MRIHGLQTGTVAIKTVHYALRGPAPLRYFSILLDRRHSAPLPIRAWAIEHPEGVIVVDTGETAAALDEAYFACDPAYAFLMRRGLLKLALTPDDEIGPQLRRVGITPADVRWVVLTHLHLDHADGLAAFPNAEILVARSEYEGHKRRSLGALACRWPAWFSPRLVEYLPQPIGPFATSFPLTQAGDVLLVPTPGHSYGHQSLIVRVGELSFFIAGDTSFTEGQLLDGTVGGICYDVQAARETLGRIRRYAASTPTIYLPSHDPEASLRLQGRQIVKGGM